MAYEPKNVWTCMASVVVPAQCVYAMDGKCKLYGNFSVTGIANCTFLLNAIVWRNHGGDKTNLINSTERIGQHLCVCENERAYVCV